MRNPEWTRDELILGLEVYVRLKTSELTDSHPCIVALSRLLNALPIHPAASRNTRFRNPAGVSMELKGFLAFDERYQGRGLRGARLGEEVWNEFFTSLPRLRRTAEAIRSGWQLLRDAGDKVDGLLAETENTFPEGSILTRLHCIYERNSTVTRRKRQAVLEATGSLACEICSFDFFEVYGDLGSCFFECHHVIPLCELPGRRMTCLADLAVVCANCHRNQCRRLQRQW